jgi:hypothetical protein
MWRTLLYKCFFAMLLAAILTTFCFTFMSTTPGFALTGSAKKTTLTLNRSQGPLGVVLTLRGKDFPPGSANLSYIDANNVPGVFTPPGDTSVEVLSSGDFLTTNLLLPSSGPIGTWKIIVTDSLGNLNTINYTVLAAHGQKTAGAPTLILTLPNGTSSGNATPTASPTTTASSTPTTTPTATSTASVTGDSGSIAFSGSNWLPKGTAVKLVLSSAMTSLPLLEPAPVSNADGMISGSIHLPANLTLTTGTIVATDTQTGALRAQVPITITNGVISFSASPTPQPGSSGTPVTSSVSTPVASSNGSSNTTLSQLANLNAAVWGPVLLIVGAILAIAGLMLILYMLPWSRNEHGHHPRGGQ